MYFYFYIIYQAYLNPTPALPEYNSTSPQAQASNTTMPEVCSSACRATKVTKVGLHMQISVT